MTQSTDSASDREAEAQRRTRRVLSNKDFAEKWQAAKDGEADAPLLTLEEIAEHLGLTPKNGSTTKGGA